MGIFHPMRYLIALLLTSTLCHGTGITLIVPGDAAPDQVAYAERIAGEAFSGTPDSLSIERGSVPELPQESYRVEAAGADHWRVLAADGAAAINAVLDLTEQMADPATGIKAGDFRPRFEYRAIKYNLPWAAYRTSPSIEQHQAICRDLDYWRDFLDMMVKNRFNVLSLWSLHPWHLMVRTPEYPEMCDLSDAELADWQAFWTDLFAMAHERGIETIMVNWNTFVSPSFSKAHGDVAGWSQTWAHYGDGPETGDLSLINDYTRTTLREVLTTYPGLTGLGITLGERMGGVSPDERRAWLEDSIFAGIREAGRPVKFLYRAPLSASHGSGGTTDPENDAATRKQVESLEAPFVQPIYVEFKFNWSHGHSSPGLYLVHGGRLSDRYFVPESDHFKAVWTVRNEDFHQLRWGQPDFVREFIRRNGQSHTGGATIGSEVFIPARDTLTRLEHAHHFKYQFERQWLLYAVWGRLLYDETTPDATFARLLEERFPKADGSALLQAWKLASTVPLRFASFHQGRIDGSLYTEAFGEWRDRGPKIHLFDIHRFINHPVLDPLYVNIRDFVRHPESIRDEQVTPPELATQLESDADEAARLLEQLRKSADENSLLSMELADIEAWGHFARYFAAKLRAGVALEQSKFHGDCCAREEAIDQLKQAVRHWKDYAETAARYNNPEFLFHTDEPMSLTSLLEQVEQDVHLADCPYPDDNGWQLTDTSGKMHKRHEAAFVECNGRFYLLGGRRIQPVDEFDPDTGEWRQMSAPPIELHHFQAIEHEGKIWVIGAMTGRYPNETPVPNMYIFDPATDTWSVGPEIPEDRRRGGGGVVTADGKIYLVAGIVRGHMGGFIPWLDRWDPATGSWEILPDAPHPRDHFQAAVIDGKIYAAGGRMTSRETNQVFANTVAEVDVYDIADRTWSTLSDPLPTPRAGTSSANVDGALVVAGGESGTQNRAHREVEAYDPRKGFWYRWPGLRQGRHGSAIIIHKGRLYTCSGSGNRGGSPELESLESIQFTVPGK